MPNPPEPPERPEPSESKKRWKGPWIIHTTHLLIDADEDDGSVEVVQLDEDLAGEEE